MEVFHEAEKMDVVIGIQVLVGEVALLTWLLQTSSCVPDFDMVLQTSMRSSSTAFRFVTLKRSS